MKMLDNKTEKLRDDLKETIKPSSKVSIAAECFSIYAFKELRKELENVKEFRFLFTSPAFVKEKAPREKKEFYIPQNERSLYGTVFEVKLRNELTQKAITKDCTTWIKKKATFKSNLSGQKMPGFMTVDDFSYNYIQSFTTVDLGCEKGDFAYYPIMRFDTSENSSFFNIFEEIWNNPSMVKDVTDTVIETMSAAYQENPADFIYFMMLYNIFHEFLDDVSEDHLPKEGVNFKNSKVWNMLYDFQKDAVLAIINKLEKYNGCILADSVGLGKTFTALAVIKYYEERNMRVLVLCPKKLSENWNTYKNNYKTNILRDDRFRYDVLYHTDLSRNSGFSNGTDLNQVVWGNYDLVVIDESHYFRNGAGSHRNTNENRYIRLMDRVIRDGVKTKVLMLSATPVNNRFIDLRNQLALAYEGDSSLINDKLSTEKSIDEIFRNAQRIFNDWSKMDVDERTTERLLKMLDFDFFELLDSVTIARSRKHIEKYYSMKDIGSFPERLKPLSKEPPLCDINDEVSYDKIYDLMDQLNLEFYTPTKYIYPSRIAKYTNEERGLTQEGREQGIRQLMGINLLKRLESSVRSFQLTVQRIKDAIDQTIETIKKYEGGKIQLVDYDVDVDDEDDVFTVGRKVQINLDDMDYVSWLRMLESDATILTQLLDMINQITPDHDGKMLTLFQVIKEKLEHPINKGNKKILIFTAFAETADYLYDLVSYYAWHTYGLHTAVITGSVEGRSTVKGMKCDLNRVLSAFSPMSKDKDLLYPDMHEEIDILIATDCISEGQNLQDCDYVINYDIHWNPVRIIQRFGRIDRIGSKNKYIQLVNFWPDIDLDTYINLTNRVKTRMKITVLTSTGDDDLINTEENGDLEYRKRQLKKLQEEVVDIEEMSDGISIMDLGLNEFRLDLLEYMKTHKDISNSPMGLHAVVKASNDLKPGVIFVLRNINDAVNIDHKNRIHPFYMVYISNNGEILCDYLNPKKLLDTFRLLCKGQSKPITDLCKSFNKQTKDGKDMHEISELLSQAISSIISIKETSDIESLFHPGGTTALLSEIKGLDDFELICFLVVR